jgi:UDP-GlcNAc:undecaprenyl-phosphate GlcNAc-1-phosphate transferase
VTSTAAAFLLALLVSAVLTPWIRNLAVSRGWVEGRSGKLKIHDASVPRLGGIAVVIGFFAPLAAIFAINANITWHLEQDLAPFLALVLGGLAIFALGLWDDIRGAGAPAKFLVQSGVAIGVWFAGLRIEQVQLPGIGIVEFGPFGWVVTLLWIVGITNALNLVDGLDGLAAGVAFFAGLSHLVIGAMNGDVIMMLFSASLCGAVLGFLPYNLHPARIFIGDCGALFLGFVLAASSIYGVNHKSTTAVAVLGPILILGLPILDTLLAMARRMLRGRSPFDGDREHVHHLLLDLGLSQRRSVLILWILCAAFALAGLVAVAANSATTAVVLISLLVVLGIFERRLGLLRRTRSASRDIETERILELARGLKADLEAAGDVDAAWTGLLERSEELEFYRLRLERIPDGGPGRRDWSRPGLAGRPRDGSFGFTAELRIAGEPWRLEIEKKPFHRTSRLADGLFAALLGGREN